MLQQLKPDTPLVRMTGIERSFLDAAPDLTELTLASHSLLIVADGHVSVAIGDSLCLASRGKCFLFVPDQPVYLRKDNPSPLTYYRIAFDVVQDGGEWFGRDREFAYEPFTRLEDCLKDLLKEDETCDRLASFHRHLLFQNLLYELLRRLPVDLDGDKDDARQAVERTIAHLHRSYREDVEIGRLAREANLSRWQYGSLFRSITGESPSRYLTSLRIEQAKRLLTVPSARVNDIAGRVGFRDEYYFSRRFKQSTGMTPTQFASSHGRSGSGTAPRIFSIQYLGELIALGIRPVGTNEAVLDVFPEAIGSIPGIAEPIDAEQLSALKPDLILYPSFLPPDLADRLSRVASAVEVDWDADVYTRLETMGELLGKRREAADWIARYKEKAENAKNKLKGVIRKGETASAFIYYLDGLYVYGGHHFGHTLYEGVGFEPPPGVQAWLDRQPNAKWQKIQVEYMPEYAGDRVFFMLADSGTDALKGRQLLEHPAWQSLPAVRSGKSYIVPDLWANYNPLTLDRHLDEMVKRLG